MMAFLVIADLWTIWTSVMSSLTFVGVDRDVSIGIEDDKEALEVSVVTDDDEDFDWCDFLIGNPLVSLP